MTQKQEGEQIPVQSERNAWHEKACNYDEYLGSVTQQIITHLLDAAAVEANMLVLDVASGPGYGAAGALKRGAHAVGIDFAPGMVAEAKSRFPQAEFYEGDGCALTFDDALFEAAVCSFGLMHMPDPEKAVAEVQRVLKPFARYAYSIWDPESAQAFFALVSSAVKAKGNPLALPAVKTESFRFSDHTKCREILTDAGFVDIQLSQVEGVWEPQNTQEVLSMLHNSTVKTAALLRHQTTTGLKAIHQAILEGAEDYRCGDALRFVWPVVVVSGQKP